MGLLLLLAGCGGGDPEVEADPAPLTGAAQEVAAAGPVRFEARISTKVDGQTQAGVATGVVDVAGRRSRMTTKFDGGPGMKVTMEQLMIGRVMYMRNQIEGFEDRNMLEDWVKFELPEAAAAQMGNASGFDPAKILEDLRAATDVKRLGEETIGGRATTHYSGHVPEDEQLRAAIPAPDEEGGPSPTPDAKPVEQPPMEVWIDAAGLPRRQLVIYRDADVEMRTQVDFLEYGVKGDFTPPKAKEIQESGSWGAELGMEHSEIVEIR